MMASADQLLASSGRSKPGATYTTIWLDHVKVAISDMAPGVRDPHSIVRCAQEVKSHALRIDKEESSHLLRRKLGASLVGVM